MQVIAAFGSLALPWQNLMDIFAKAVGNGNLQLYQVCERRKYFMVIAL